VWLRRAWLTYWAVLFVVMHVPVPERIVPTLHVSDKVIHFLAYLVLTIVGGIAVCVRGRRDGVGQGSSGAGAAGSAGRAVACRRLLALWAGVYVAYAAVDEWLQQFVNRTTSLTDWYADVAGVATGTLMLLLLRPARFRSGSEEDSLAHV